MHNIKGLATGLGSFPHTDADAALDLISRHVPRIPFWPQLPKRDLREGMIAQFSENIPCLKVNAAGLYFDPRGKEEVLEKFYEKAIAQDLDYFKISDAYASGLHKFYGRLAGSGFKEAEFIKLQITGPFTFAAGINDASGVSLLHDKIFMQAFSQGLKLKALWQINKFKGFGKKIIMFIDEPYLGCFGSAYTSINREDVLSVLSEFSAGISPENALLGVHCCGNTDWSMLAQAKGIDIISFDAFDYLDKFVLYAQDIKKFLDKGGMICWGVVPTQSFTGEENAELLARKIRRGIESLVKKGLGEEPVKSGLFISPACGLGTFEAQKAEKVFQLLSETSDFIRKNF